MTTITLRKPQIRILKTLAWAKAPLSRSSISERAEVDIAWVGDHLGRTEKADRAAREAITGYPSLITLGYATVGETDVYGDGSTIEVTYSITPAGREAAKQVE